MKVDFGTTDVVRCRFSLKTSSNADPESYDEYGRFERAYTLKEYIFRLTPGCTVNVGDIVVVYCSTGYQVCEVSEINAIVTEEARRKLAYVVSVVDMHGYMLTLDQEKQKDRLRRQIDNVRKEIEAETMYEMLAEKSPEFKQLLDQYKELGGTFG